MTRTRATDSRCRFAWNATWTVALVSVAVEAPVRPEERCVSPARPSDTVHEDILAAPGRSSNAKSELSPVTLSTTTA